MQSANCSLPAPLLYRTIMQVSHVISFPIYTATLFFLFRHHEKSFQTYKYFLIGHTVLNLLSEVHVSFLYLPVSYLPYPVLRGTGLLANWHFSGLFQWYIFATFVILTGVSIIEMFYFRFKVSILDADKHKFMKILRFGIWSFRFLIAVHTVFAFLTFNYLIEIIGAAKQELVAKSPGAPPEILCYTSIMAVTDNWTKHMTLAMYTSMVMIAMVITPSSVYYIMRFLLSCNLSAATVRMQKMFIISLTFQALVHGVMIAAPVVGAVMIIISLLHFDESAYIFILILNFHGFCSTCTMIVFTKPLRDKFLNLFCRTSNTAIIAPPKTVSVTLEMKLPDVTTAPNNSRTLADRRSLL